MVSSAISLKCPLLIRAYVRFDWNCRSTPFYQELLLAFQKAAPDSVGEAGAQWSEEGGEGFLSRVLAFGPRNVGANLLARWEACTYITSCCFLFLTYVATRRIRRSRQLLLPHCLAPLLFDLDAAALWLCYAYGDKISGD